MGITDFLFSLHKLLAWLFALLTVLLPQHILLPRSDSDPAATSQMPAPQLCVQTSIPAHKLDRVALALADAGKAGPSASAPQKPEAAKPAPQSR